MDIAFVKLIDDCRGGDSYENFFLNFGIFLDFMNSARFNT